MDKLEHYLDLVCRSIGGPRAMRQHVRQELREHLRDAAAEHRAAGLSEVEALDRALEEFGKPEDVRSELEATHGHRLLPVVIDKAMQWKEATMRAKWLWMTGAYIAAALVIVLEVFFILFNVVFIIPKFQKLTHDGIIDPATIEESSVSWIPGFLSELRYIGEHYSTWLLLLAVAAVGLFGWRVKSENKPFIGLTLLGAAAVGLMLVVILTSGSMVIAFCLGAPAVSRMSRPWAVEQVATIEKSVAELEQAMAKKDWKAMPEPVEQASNAMSRLSIRAALVSLRGWNEPPTVAELEVQVKAAREALLEARQAVREKDASRLETALQRFRTSFRSVREAAKRPAR